MPGSRFRGDCDHCAALCCVAVAFDRSKSFGFDKAADTPCRNLDRGHGCTVHGHLAASGFRGCVAYDCHGAGQAVTQGMFGGRSWRDDPALLPAMSEAFRLLRRVYELRLILEQARALPLRPAEMARLEILDGALDPEGGWTLPALRAFAEESLAGEVRAFLRELGSDNHHLRGRLRDLPLGAAA